MKQENDTETGTDDIEHQPNEYAPNELPEKPAYDREIDENVDDALEDAYKTCKIANNEYLENMLKNELASYRYRHLEEVETMTENENTENEEWEEIVEEVIEEDRELLELIGNTEKNLEL